MAQQPPKSNTLALSAQDEKKGKPADEKEAQENPPEEKADQTEKKPPAASATSAAQNSPKASASDAQASKSAPIVPGGAQRPAAPSKDRMVTVTVAPRKSIQARYIRGEKPTASDPIKQFMPGEQCQVPAWQIPSLLARNVIVNPDDRPLPKGAEDVDISGYFKSEDSPVSIKQG